jgi:VWFA-related protein
VIVPRRAPFVAVAALAAWGQTPVPQPTFRTEANYVRVDAYPTRNGLPITDLTRDDFEISEGGQPQKIEQFEYVNIRGNTPQELRPEPNTIRESLEMARNPRARVMVVFLDIGHVGVDGSHRIRQPLIEMLNRFVGEDDVVAVMTSKMSPRDITFARRTIAIENFLTKNWPWGERDTLVTRDPIEQMFENCYDLASRSVLTRALIARHRERQTLEVLTGLTDWLHDVREERKAVLVVTDGWQLYRQDAAVLNRDPNRAAPPAIGTVAGTGRPAIAPETVPGTAAHSECERYRTELAYFDGEAQYRQLLDRANRANASFYPVTPVGLVVFASPLGPAPPVPLQQDAAVVRQRADSMRTLSDATDGVAIISNDLDRVLRRVVSDLSSYYLLGYYSTAKLDGRFHSISVKVKRPGVDVRARRGYLAPSASPILAATASDANLEAEAATAAIAPLADYGRDVALRLQAAAGWKPAAAGAAVWVTGELGGVTRMGGEWKSGGVADVQLIGPSGTSIASGRATIASGAATFRIVLAPAEGMAAGEYTIRAGARAGAAAIPARDSLRFTLPAEPGSTGAAWIRRGPSTGNRDAATADLRFRRNEQIRLEIPTAAAAGGPARLLYRAGKPLAVPITAALRDDSDGSRWTTAQLALAPLAPGDYVIEISDGERRILTAFRVVP